MSDAVAQIPTLEQYPVSGEPGAITVQAGGVLDSSRLLAGQGNQVASIASSLAPNWTGQAASSYQTLSARTAGAFIGAALELAGAAKLMFRYAAELERLQSEARAAAQQSTHWHEQIVTWTGKLAKAQTDVRTAETALRTAQGQYTSALARGPKGAAAAGAALAAEGRARAALERAQTELSQAQRQLRQAHEQFTHWQDRARRIRDAAKQAGEELSLALLLITIVPPPLPGAPDYPPLEPTPGILLNNGGKQEEPGGQGGDGEQGGKGGNGDQGGEPPKIEIRVGPDGKIIPPERPPTKPVIGDAGEAQRQAGRETDRHRSTQPKESPLILLGRLITGILHLPPPPPPKV